MSRFKENVTSGIFNAIQLASIKAMDDGDRAIENMLTIYQRRRDMVRRVFDEIGIMTKGGDGTFYLWVAAPSGSTSLEFATKLLDEASVLVTPGIAYGQYGEGYFRVSLTVPDNRLEQALERIRKAVKKG
jgi:LL-diaminopimelate aminotransferase